MEYTGKNQHGGRGYFPFAFFPQDIYFLYIDFNINLEVIPVQM